jgi:hypothetical protein
MADTPRATEGSPAEQDAASASGTPRWVKVFAAVALALIVLVVVLLVAGRGGGHGPGQHALSGDEAAHTGATIGIAQTRP